MKNKKVTGYHIVFQMEIGVNASSTAEAFVKGEEQAEIIRDSLEKFMPVVGKVKVFLKRPNGENI